MDDLILPFPGTTQEDYKTDSIENIWIKKETKDLKNGIRSGYRS